MNADRNRRGKTGSNPAIGGDHVREMLIAGLLAVGLLIYFLWFSMLPMAPAEDDGFVYRRLHIYLLQPARIDSIVREWVGGGSERMGLLDRVPVLAAVILLLAAAWLAGRLTLHALGVDRWLRRLETFVFATAIGLTLWSTYFLAVGLLCRASESLQLQDRLWFWVPVVLLSGRLIMVRKRLRTALVPRRDTNDLEADDSPATADEPSWWGRWGWLTAAPFALLILFGAMIPPWHFDAREYHFQAPREWFENGQVDFLPHNVYANMPLGAEMHAVVAMNVWPTSPRWWWGANAGKGVVGCMTLLTALGLYCFGERFFSRSAGVVAAALYLSIPWIVMVSVSGLIEGASGLYWFLTFYTCVLVGAHSARRGAGSNSSPEDQPEDQPEDTDPRPRIPLAALAGLLAGAATTCKYPALGFVVAPAGVWMLVGAAPLRWRSWSWGRATVFALTALAAGGLWYAKNWALTGNPTYPLLYSVFGGESWNESRDAQWSKAHQTPRNSDGDAYTVDAAIQAVTLTLGKSKWLSPLLIPFALIAWVSPAHRKLQLAMLLAFVYVIVVWWLLTHRIDRFWIPALPVICLLAGVGAMARRTSKAWSAVATTALITHFLLAFPVVSSRYLIDNRVLMAYSEFITDAPNASDPGYNSVSSVHTWLNDHTPAGKAVMLVGDAQPFNIRAKVYYSTCFDACHYEQWIKGRTSAERRRILEERGVAYIWFDWAEIRRYRNTYGFTNYVQRDQVYSEMVEGGILRPVRLELSPDVGELFAVVGVASAGDPLVDPSKAPD